MAHQKIGGKTKFTGLGLPKAPRRGNGTAPDRLLYPRIRPEQRGTVMERAIIAKFAELIADNNNRQHPLNKMAHTDMTGSLKQYFKKVYNTNIMSRVKEMRKKIKKIGPAKKMANDFFTVSFGADPKRK